MTENIKINRFFLPSIALSQFASSLPGLLLSLLLIDMASTFGASIGSMSQLNTASSTVAIISALFLTTLSVIFRHKSLLLIGLLALIISVLVCVLAPNYISILLAYSLTGITLAMTVTMGVTLIRDHLPLKKGKRNRVDKCWQFFSIPHRSADYSLYS